MSQTQLLAPFLSQRDEAESAEGGLDPLGLYPIADALAGRLVPGVRERQLHPRFLTAIAVSRELCGEIDAEEFAAPGAPPPWLVFEWYFVEGLARTAEADETRGLPGSLKANQAIADGVPLSVRRYLKSPAYFGFQAIYRALAEELGIEDDGRLGEAGRDLLEVWSREQGLSGFLGTAGGPGRKLRQDLLNALRDGLTQRSTARPPKWPLWQAFSEHLGIYNAHSAERRKLCDLLLRGAQGHRREVLEFLTSAAGRREWESNESERSFHAALRGKASPELRELLDAISVYEAFARQCTDAFEDCLYEMSRQSSSTGWCTLKQLSGMQGVAQASRRVPEEFALVRQRLEPYGLAQRFEQAFASLGEPTSPLDWVARLIAHHEKTQENKKPMGKRAWLQRDQQDRLNVRLLYRRDEPPAHDDEYAHAYRTRSLWSFARDLHLVKESS